MTTLDDRETAVSWLNAMVALTEAVDGLDGPVRAAVESGEFDSKDGGTVGLDLLADLDDLAKKVAEARAQIERRLADKHVRTFNWEGFTHEVAELGLTAKISEKSATTVHLPLVARLASQLIVRDGLADPKTGEVVSLPPRAAELFAERLFEFLQSPKPKVTTFKNRRAEKQAIDELTSTERLDVFTIKVTRGPVKTDG